MGPLGFLTGVVLGSAASIASVLVMVMVIFMLSASEHPTLLAEYQPLWRAAGSFAVLGVVAALAFWSLQRRLAWRWAAQAAMWLSLVAIAWWYWPEPVA